MAHLIGKCTVIAAGTASFYDTDGVESSADFLSKHGGYRQIDFCGPS